MNGRIYLFLSLLVLAGCGQEAEKKSPVTAAKTGSQYLLSSEPLGAQNVVAARKSAKDGDKVVVVGSIGGKEDPWIKGKAAFRIVDMSRNACQPDEGCPTPWDYCCADLTGAVAFIQIVDENGKVVDKDARELLSLKELQTVVVSGKAKRDEAGNFTIHASQLHVRK